MKAYDISHWNNEEEVVSLLNSTVDCPSFLYIKRSEGLNTVQSEYYESMKREAHKKGVCVGGYHYINPNASEKNYNFYPTVAAEREALRLRQIQDCSDLIPMMDVEENYLLASPKGLVNYLRMVHNAFLDNGGNKLGIYASYSLLKNKDLQKLILDRGIYLWCARYKYKDAHLTYHESVSDILHLLQVQVGEIPVSINQFCTKYYAGYTDDTLNLDCNIVLRPRDLLQ